MEKKNYKTPQVFRNELYTISSLALDVVISNTTVDNEATKQRNDKGDKNKESDVWGNIW